jgi:3-methyladenine DNA glycosylase AlkD
MDVAEVLARLEELGDRDATKGRARFGLREEGYGVSLPKLRKLAKEIGKDDALAKALWRAEVHDARMLATLVADPAALTRAQAERWLEDVRSWDLCDGLALNVFDKTAWAWKAAPEWAAREPEWVKRAGLATMAGLAWHAKDAPDARFMAYFAVVERAALDERNYVKKAASWALRQMGKRSPALRTRALASARRLEAREERPARWVARDVIKELS